MLIDGAADMALYLADSAQPLTLSWRSTRRESEGVVDFVVDPIRFLSQGRAIPSCIVTMSKAEAAILTIEWTISFDNETRPVLEVVDDHSGIVNVHLGDSIKC